MGNKTISFTIKGEEYVINVDVITACLKLPKNNFTEMPTNTDIVNMLRGMGYALDTNSLSRGISRK